MDLTGTSIAVPRARAAALSVIAALFVAGAANASALSDLAASLQPGQWAQLNTQGFNQALLGDSGGHNILMYSEDIVWDPGSKQLLFVGGGHGSDAAFITYSEASNSWQTRTLPGGYWSSSFSHAYDHQAIIPATGRFYHRQPGGGDRLEIYDISGNSWTRSSPFPGGAPQCCGGLEWFPELGRIVYVDGDFGVYLYNPTNDQWTTSTRPAGLGPYHNFAEYSPVHKVLMLGGGNGSTALYKMTSNGTITRVGDSPEVTGTSHGLATIDPNSGNFLFFFDNGYYEYNPTTDTWLRQSGSAPFGGTFDAVATPISSYGVVLVAKYNGDSSRVWLYRHSPGSGATQPTVSLSANPTSIAPQATSTLTWSSTNASSCTASGGWTGSKATSGTETVGPLSATQTYTLTCTSSGGGSANRSVTVTVASSTPAPTVTFTANPTSVALNLFSTLQWTSSDAASCTGSGGIGSWPGTKATQGSESVGPLTAQVTFNLSCTGAGGTTQKSATISILGAPTVNFSANPTSVQSGGRSTLTWSTTSATSCTAAGAWAGNKATSGSEQTAALTTTSNFVLDCTGAGGTTQRNVNVTVDGAPPAPTVALSASPMTVNVNGSAMLTWSSTNAGSCTANDAWSGSKATSGSESTGALTNTQTYTLTCTGAGGSGIASATVTVSPGGGGGGNSTNSGGGSLGWLSVAGLAMLLLTRRRGVVAV